MTLETSCSAELCAAPVALSAYAFAPFDGFRAAFGLTPPAAAGQGDGSPLVRVRRVTPCAGLRGAWSRANDCRDGGSLTRRTAVVPNACAALAAPAQLDTEDDGRVTVAATISVVSTFTSGACEGNATDGWALFALACTASDCGGQCYLTAPDAVLPLTQCAAIASATAGATFARAGCGGPGDGRLASESGTCVVFTTTTAPPTPVPATPVPTPAPTPVPPGLASMLRVNVTILCDAAAENATVSYLARMVNVPPAAVSAGIVADRPCVASTGPQRTLVIELTVSNATATARRLEIDFGDRRIDGDAPAGLVSLHASAVAIHVPSEQSAPLSLTTWGLVGGGLVVLGLIIFVIVRHRRGSSDRPSAVAAVASAVAAPATSLKALMRPGGAGAAGGSGRGKHRRFAVHIDDLAHASARPTAVDGDGADGAEEEELALLQRPLAPGGGLECDEEAML